MARPERSDAYWAEVETGIEQIIYPVVSRSRFLRLNGLTQVEKFPWSAVEMRRRFDPDDTAQYQQAEISRQTRRNFLGLVVVRHELATATSFGDNFGVVRIGIDLPRRRLTGVSDHIVPAAKYLEDDWEGAVFTEARHDREGSVSQPREEHHDLLLKEVRNGLEARRLFDELLPPDEP